MAETPKNKDLSKQIEEIKKENSQLKEKLQAFEKILDDSAVAVIIGDTKGLIIRANKKALQLTAYSLEEIIKLKVRDLFISNDIPKSLSVKKTEEPSDEFSNERLLLCKNGKKLYVSVKTKILKDNLYQLLITNIDKRKKAELKLIESEKRYRLLAENVHDVVWSCSTNLKLNYISSTIKKITDYSSDVYYVKPLHELVTPISLKRIIGTYKKEVKLRKTGTIPLSDQKVTFEIKLKHRKHENVWVEVTATTINNNKGISTGFQGVIRNIDKQKRAQKILEEKNKRYDFAIKSTGSGVWTLNADLTKINIDTNLLHILGYESSEIKPQLNDWINITAKKDRITIMDILQDMLDGKKVTISYECRRIHKSGDILWFKDYVEAVYNSNGNIKELIGTSTNITEEKRNEEKKYKYYAGLQILTDSALHLLNLPDLKSICDYAGKILLQNIPNSIIIFSEIDENSREATPIKYFGVKKHMLLSVLNKTGFKPFEGKVILPKRDIDLLRKNTLIEYQGGFPEFIRALFQKKDAEIINEAFKFNNVHMIGISQHDELIKNITLISRDADNVNNKEFIEAFINLLSVVLNRKIIETELVNLNKTKDKFFSIISHDLKNPFNTFIGFSELILQNYDTISKEKMLQFAELIYEGAVQSHSLMQNLFDWVSTQKQEIKVKREKLKVKKICDSIIKLLAAEALKKEIKLVCKTDTELEINSDYNIIHTILRNLTSNAIKFTNKGGLIELSYEKKNDSLQFNVKDNGIGISDKNKAILFDVHTNPTTEGTEYEPGSGLGLILCKEFIDILEGEIWVESEKGKGAKFSFTVPGI